MPCLPEPGLEATTGDEAAGDDTARPAQAAAAEAVGREAEPRPFLRYSPDAPGQAAGRGRLSCQSARDREQLAGVEASVYPEPVADFGVSARDTREISEGTAGAGSAL
jgi:hypothetical protein